MHDTIPFISHRHQRLKSLNWNILQTVQRSLLTLDVFYQCQVSKEQNKNIDPQEAVS